MSRVAIVGSGISGMGAAYLLNGAGHDVTVYEAGSHVGGHARTLQVPYGNRDVAVDTGFIVFNHQNYPHLCGMFRHLGVATEKSDMTFALSENSGELEWGAKNPNAVFGQRSNLLRPEFWGFVFDIFRFNRKALKTAQANPGMTLGQLLAHIGTGEWYAKYFILPIGGAIWSCSLEQMLHFPALTFVDFFKRHGLLSVVGQPQWYTVTGGSREYVKRLVAPYQDKIRLNTPVVRVERGAAGVSVTDAHGQSEVYEQVVMACHGDQALAMLSGASEKERDILGTFSYSRNMVVLHRDETIMPKRKRCWASWVYHAEESVPKGQISVTYWMNLLQNIDFDKPLFVTLNPHREIPEERIFNSHMFEHPVYTPASIAASARLPEIQGKDRVWFCGAHWRNGFHEDGLASGVAVAQALGAKVPWL